MGATLVITKSLICLTFVFTYFPLFVYGGRFCAADDFSTGTICSDDEYCCGFRGNQCCKKGLDPYFTPVDPPGPSPSRPQQEAMEVVATLIVLMTFTCCCICCYRCCCRRTTSRGYVYSTPGATTAVSVTLPPQHHQQVPYPTVVPYPQQTPYPPQYNPPTNPYYGMPPPAYGVAVQSENQQASAPSAPYM